MADDITTVLRFEGDTDAVRQTIDGLIGYLNRAADSVRKVFDEFGKRPSLPKLVPPETASDADNAKNSILALAQAQARLQTAQGNGAAAAQTLRTALDSVDRSTVAAIRAQTQLVGIEAQLATSAGKAETAMLREAQALARVQQQLGNTSEAAKILDDAFKQASNKGSLAALRVQLQKTYLDTNYENSPLISAIRAIGQTSGELIPVTGRAGSALGQLATGAEGVVGSLGKLGAGGVAAGVIAGLVAIAAAAVAAEVAILKMSVAVAESLAELDRLSERTGITEANLFKFKIAAENVGVAFSTVIEQFDFFNSNLAKAAQGGPADKLAQSLKKLGIDAKKAADEPGPAFDQLAVKIGSLKNPVERMAAITTFFGEEGRKLVPVFIEISRNADKYREALNRLGGAEGIRRTIQASAELDRELKRLGGVFGQLKIQVSQDVIPALVVAIRSLIPILQELAPIAVAVGRAVALSFLAAVAVIQTLVEEVRTAGKTLDLVMRGNFAGAFAQAGRVVGDVSDRFKTLVGEMYNVGRGADVAAGGFKGVGDAAKKSSNAAQDRLKEIQQRLRDEEEAYKVSAAAIKRSFDQRTIDEQEFVQSQTALAQERLTKTLALLDQEKAAAGRLSKDDRKTEFARIERERVAARRQATEEIEKIEDDSRQRLDRLAIQRAEAEVDVERAALERRRAAIKSAADQRLIDEETAETELTAIARREIELRIGLTEAELERVRGRAAEEEVIKQKLIKLEVELSTITEEGQRKVEAARGKSAAAFTDYIRAIVQGVANLRKAQLDAAAAETALALQRGQISQRAAQIQELERRRELIRLESIERQRAIEREAEQQAQQAREAGVAAAALVQIERQKNEALKAERERAEAERQALLEQQRAAVLAPEIGDAAANAVAGIEQSLGRQLTFFERLRVEAQLTAQTMREQIPGIASVFVGAKDAIVGSLAEMIAGFAAGRTGLRKAAAALYAAALQPLKDYLLKKSKAEFALALADAAMGNFAGAAKHALAGAGLAAAAGLIDVGGAAIAGGGGGGGAVGGAIAGGGGTGNNVNQQNARTIEQGGPLERERQVIILRPEFNVRGDLSRGVLSLVAEDYQNNGPTRQLLRRDLLGEG